MKKTNVEKLTPFKPGIKIIIVAGGRDFNKPRLLLKRMDHLTKRLTTFEVYTGAAKGADKIGEAWALHRFQRVTNFYPDWIADKKAAGVLRNIRMAEEAKAKVGRKKVALVAFWDGVSKGTKNMIAIARRHKFAVRVVRY